MYKIPHEELLAYKAYFDSVYTVAINNKPYIVGNRIHTDKFSSDLNKVLYAGQYGGGSLVVADNRSLCLNATLEVVNGVLWINSLATVMRSKPYLDGLHSVYLLTKDEADRLQMITDHKGFNIGTGRFRHYEGRNSLILMGLESDVTVVVFTIELPHEAPIRYITKFESLCILNRNYERIPANQVTEQQLITALEQTLADECGLIKVHSPTIYTVRSNVEITELELYNGKPIPQPD